MHEITGSDGPQGWDTQLANEPGLEMAGQRSWRRVAESSLARLDFGLTPHVGAALGNVYIYGNGGLTLRYGRNLASDHGPPCIQPSFPGSGFFVPPADFGWYFYVRFEASVVARNIFLDGNTFEDSRSVDKEPLVGDVQWGLVLTWPRIRVSDTQCRCRSSPGGLRREGAP